MRTVIVTDGNERSALAVVRSLGAAQYRCVVVASSMQSLAAASRFCAASFVAPSPLDSPGAFADALVRIARDEGAALMLPISEASLLAVLPERTRFGNCIIPFADESAFRAISDKQRVLSEAAAIGIRTPAQVVIAEKSTVAATSVEALHYPVVAKPSRSVGEAGGARQKFGVRYASESAELQAVLASFGDAAFPVLLQQRIAGPGTGVFLLVWDDVLYAAFAHRRITEKPPSGGVSVDRESIPLDARLLEQSRELLSRFGWRGVAMVEFKTDQRTNTPYLMEINGRFWGSLQLAIDSGVDFPVLLAALALGDAPTPVSSYRTRIRSRWFWGQIDHLVSRVPRAGRHAALPPGTISVPRAFADIALAPFRNNTFEEIFRWNDPRPFLHETYKWMRGR